MGFNIHNDDGSKVVATKMVPISYFGIPGLGGHTGVDVLGGKGEGLRMLAKHYPEHTAPGFTITTHASKAYDYHAPKALAKLRPHVEKAYKTLAKHCGGPVLVSVRSGAPVSMPGMMESILNVGLIPSNLSYWEDRLPDELVVDCYLKLCTQLEADPEDNYFSVGDQLMDAIERVLDSWNSPNASAYRKEYGISSELGTAVNVQAMVFTNLPGCASGVYFTRDTRTGHACGFGEFIEGQQGPALVDGTHEAQPISELPDAIAGEHPWGVEVSMDLVSKAEELEATYGTVQDIEFAVGKPCWDFDDAEPRLFLLQRRSAKLSPRAAFQIARDRMHEGTLSWEDLPKHLSGRLFAQATQPAVESGRPASFQGQPASPGVAFGTVTWLPEVVLQRADVPMILCRPETTVDDYEAMSAAAGIITQVGSLTCHAAVNARGLGKPCIVNVRDDGHYYLPEGATVVLDGTSGAFWTSCDDDETHYQLPEIEAPGMTEAMEELVTQAYTQANAVPILGRLLHAGAPAHVCVASWVEDNGPQDALASFEVLEKTPAKATPGVVLDFTDASALVTPHDSKAWEVVGVDPFEGHRARLESLAHELVGRKYGTTVVLPEWLEEKVGAVMTEAGYRVALPAYDVGDLFSASGGAVTLDLSEELLEKLGGDLFAYWLLGKAMDGGLEVQLLRPSYHPTDMATMAWGQD